MHPCALHCGFVHVAKRVRIWGPCFKLLSLKINGCLMCWVCFNFSKFQLLFIYSNSSSEVDVSFFQLYMCFLGVSFQFDLFSVLLLQKLMLQLAAVVYLFEWDLWPLCRSNWLCLYLFVCVCVCALALSRLQSLLAEHVFKKAAYLLVLQIHLISQAKLCFVSKQCRIHFKSAPVHKSWKFYCIFWFKNLSRKQSCSNLFYKSQNTLEMCVRGSALYTINRQCNECLYMKVSLLVDCF